MHSVCKKQRISKSNHLYKYDGGDCCVSSSRTNDRDVNDLIRGTCFKMYLREEYERIASVLLNENETMIGVVVVDLASIQKSFIYYVKKKRNSYTKVECTT